MYTNISNVIKGLIGKIEENRQHIDSIVSEYENGKIIHVFEGMRKSIPADMLPSLELEPVDGSMEWQTTETQNVSYSVEFTLCTSTTDDNIAVEYITTLAREFLHLFNTPANMSFMVPNEKTVDPVNKIIVPTVIQYGSIPGCSFNATKDGSIRVATWTWTGYVRESYPRDYDDYQRLEESPIMPREFPPLENNNGY